MGTQDAEASQKNCFLLSTFCRLVSAPPACRGGRGGWFPVPLGSQPSFHPYGMVGRGLPRISPPAQLRLEEVLFEGAFLGIVPDPFLLPPLSHVSSLSQHGRGKNTSPNTTFLTLKSSTNRRHNEKQLQKDEEGKGEQKTVEGMRNIQEPAQGQNARLTLIVLVVESHLTENGNNHLKSVSNSSKTEQHCWETEPFKIIEPCHPCSEFEIASKSVEACISSHFKEGIKCQVSGITQRSCTVQWIKEKKFWTFEISMFILALTSYSIVFVRQRVLDRRVMLRIQKQLANGLVS